MAQDVYQHIKHNNIKTVFLVLLFPIILGVIMFVLSCVFMSVDEALNLLYTAFPVIICVCFIWTIISYSCGSNMMLGFAGAHELDENSTENKKVFKCVENVALAAGLPTPRVYVIKDESLNAFATGTSPDNASVALTSGIINKLTPLELEAVIAHEMGHIKNRDVRLDVIIITCLGALTLLSDLIARTFIYSDNIRVSSNDDKEQNSARAILLIVWLSLMVFNFLIAPIIYFSLSRTREYAADAESAHITRNPSALISALQKISGDSRVESLDTCKLMGNICIANPLGKKRMFAGIGETHPPVEKRIQRLKSMRGF
jgi:heat shock protein HtpX